MGRAGARPVYLRSRQCSPGEDGGDVLRADAVQVQVDLRRAFDRSPLRRWERVGGPHRNGEMRGYGGRAPAGLWARIVQRLLALNAVIWFNWQIGAPVKRSLIAYDH